jgi:hypothetical protein
VPFTRLAHLWSPWRCAWSLVGRWLRPLDELERRVVARSIVEHLKLSKRIFERGPAG